MERKCQIPAKSYCFFFLIENPLLVLTKNKKEKFIREIRQEKRFWKKKIIIYLKNQNRNTLFQQKRDLYSEFSPSESKIIQENEVECFSLDQTDKSREIDVSLDKYYLEYTDKKSEIEDKDSVLTSLKKLLDEADGFFFQKF